MSTAAAPLAATPTPTQITASTTKASELQSILALIASFAAAELPVFLQLNHNPTTQAEVAGGVLAAEVASSVVA